MCCVNEDAVPAKVDETQSLVKPVVVLKDFDLPDDVCCNILIFVERVHTSNYAFTALTLLAGRQEEDPACKN